MIASAADLGALLSLVPDLAHTCIEFVSEQVQWKSKAGDQSLNVKPS